jgi:phosphoribosylglycinamide formyltransferase 1
MMKKLVIFASGSGSNAENLIRYFMRHQSISVDHIITNNANATVIEKAKALRIPTFFFSNNVFKEEPNIVLDHLKLKGIDGIVLAGFLRLFPKVVIDAYPKAIINVHPALLPNHGGKGMYGMHVHKAVIDNMEKESGITIHYVNEHFDEGEWIQQFKCPVLETDTPEILAQKIQALEYKNLPLIVEQVFA